MSLISRLGEREPTYFLPLESNYLLGLPVICCMTLLMDALGNAALRNISYLSSCPSVKLETSTCIRSRSSFSCSNRLLSFSFRRSSSVRGSCDYKFGIMFLIVKAINVFIRMKPFIITKALQNASNNKNISLKPRQHLSNERL